jgi:hypothetical protein
MVRKAYNDDNNNNENNDVNAITSSTDIHLSQSLIKLYLCIMRKK